MDILIAALIILLAVTGKVFTIWFAIKYFSEWYVITLPSKTKTEL